MLSLDSVWEASLNIREYVKKTPVLHAESLSKVLGFSCYLKAENFQVTGSFKIRGAANSILKLVKQRPSLPGLVAASSGNHGQAVAYTANNLGIPAIIVMPESASKTKVDAVAGYGAKIEYAGSTTDSRIARAEEVKLKTGYIEIPPYDHFDVIAGQGTIAKEILEQMPDIDTVIIPVGGGGLISGIASTIKTLKPGTTVVGVEPEKSNSMYKSIKKGKITRLKDTKSMADGLLALQPGGLTFPLVKKYVDRIVLVKEEDIFEALKLCLDTFKVVAEPSGAVSLAAALKEDWGVNKKVMCIISGGNCDVSVYLNKKC